MFDADNTSTGYPYEFSMDESGNLVAVDVAVDDHRTWMTMAGKPLSLVSQSLVISLDQSSSTW